MALFLISHEGSATVTLPNPLPFPLPPEAVSILDDINKKLESFDHSGFRIVQIEPITLVPALQKIKAVIDQAGPFINLSNMELSFSRTEGGEKFSHYSSGESVWEPFWNNTISIHLNGKKLTISSDSHVEEIMSKFITEFPPLGDASDPFSNQNFCPNIDLSKNFGKKRDQDGHGLCWAFAGAGLLEERNCRNNPENCGKSISPLSVSLCNFSILSSFSEGGNVEPALECAFEKGACYEEDAPYSRVNVITKCKLKNFFAIGRRRERCINKAVKNELAKIMEFQKSSKMSNSASEKFSLDECKLENKNNQEIQACLAKIQKLLPHLNAEYIADVTNISKYSKWDAWIKLMVPDSCEKNKLSFLGSVSDPPKVISKKFSKYRKKSEQELYSMFNLLRFNLSRGTSVATSICVNRVNPFSKALNYGKTNYNKECSGHALIINGMKWDKKSKKCKINYRNTWGEIAPFDGLYNARDALKITSKFIYIGK